MRDTLRLEDLVSGEVRRRETSKLVSVKVPVLVLSRTDRVVARLGATKMEVLIALLNAGLDTAESELKRWTPPPPPVVPKERRCRMRGCHRQRVAKGRCATHYQAHRRARGS